MDPRKQEIMTNKLILITATFHLIYNSTLVEELSLTEWLITLHNCYDPLEKLQQPELLNLIALTFPAKSS